jgi:serine/threonine-protein kinase
VKSIHVDVSEDGRLFQMMELVEGESLESLLARARRLPPAVAARLGAVLAEGLAAAHAAGVVHRDVKPSNVMLTRAVPGLKLLDFGIAKLRDGRGPRGPGEGLPAIGDSQALLLGTPEFISPEQVDGSAPAGTPADVYALGLILYLSLAGTMPFSADSTRKWLITQVLTVPVELTTHVPDVDPTLARTVMDCLRKDPEGRPTAAEVAATLSQFADAAGTPPLEALDLARAAGAAAPVEGAPATASKVSDEAFRAAVTLAAERTPKP